MTSETSADDAVLVAALRRTWTHADPVPPQLCDAMVAAVAAADLGREYALLTLVDSAADAAVRGDADMFTMQFSDGRTSVLIHVTPCERDARRIDGWIDGDAAEVYLIRDDAQLRAEADGGRFSFEDVSPGIVRLRVVLAPVPGDAAELLTPRFEI
ncbi:MAG: hypothetical protein QM677_03995 [Microbacterium sp.]